jgi:hypothetical protein
MNMHTVFVIGKRDIEADAVSVRIDGKSNLRAEVTPGILTSIKERRAS